MAGKGIVAAVVSALLVVGAVIGTVVVVHRNGKDAGSTNTSTSVKAVTTVCQPTEYKEACTRSLSDVATNSSATPKDYIMKAIQATAEELKKGMEAAVKSKDGLKNKADLDRIKNCEELLGTALEELDVALKIVLDTEMHNIQEKVDTVLVWLTAVRAYQTTCIDEIDNPELKKSMQDSLVNATQLTYNAQSIVYHVIDILKEFGFDLKAANFRLPSRKLLADMGPDGYPSWVSAADRKLLEAAVPPVQPNAVVAKDGSGQFKDIQSAFNACDKKHPGRYVVYVKAGVYNEKVYIKNCPNVYMYGDGREKTIVTNDDNFALRNTGTSKTATIQALSDGFMVRGMTIRNTAGPAGHQAVALRIQSFGAVVYDCSIEGYQDTLYYHTKTQFYKNCAISGTVDFIFGTGKAVIQDSVIIVRKPDPNQSNMVTADGRSKVQEAAGVVIQNCRIIASPELFPSRFETASYLGRPWKAWSRAIIMESEIGDLIRPQGWLEWQSDKPDEKNNHLTAFYREYANRGPGAVTNMRVRWPSWGVITNKKEALQFTAGPFLDGAANWLRDANIPHNLGLTF